jgi:hypothetical protein
MPVLQLAGQPLPPYYFPGIGRPGNHFSRREVTFLPKVGLYVSLLRKQQSRLLYVCDGVPPGQVGTLGYFLDCRLRWSATLDLARLGRDDWLHSAKWTVFTGSNYFDCISPSGPYQLEGLIGSNFRRGIDALNVSLGSLDNLDKFWLE